MTYIVIALGVLLIAETVVLVLVTRELHWARKILEWTDQRDEIVVQIYQQAEVVVTVPVHELGHDHHGNVTHSSGTLLNYETLRAMLEVLQEQESARRVYTKLLRESLQALKSWEVQHPMPEHTPIIHKKAA